MLWIMVVALAAGVFGAMQRAPGASAQEQPEPDARWDSERCLGCHDGDTSTLPLPSGEQLDLGVDGDSFMSSPHAATGVQCAHCHTAIAGYPHPDMAIPDARTFTVELSKACNLCHWREVTTNSDRTHALVSLEVRDDVPVCADCHDSHATRALAVDHSEMQARCANCHAEQPSGDVQEIHLAGPSQFEEASAPPVILFYLLIVGVVILLVALGWGGVAGWQWLRRRLARAE